MERFWVDLKSLPESEEYEVRVSPVTHSALNLFYLDPGLGHFGTIDMIPPSGDYFSGAVEPEDADRFIQHEVPVQKAVRVLKFLFSGR